MHQVKCRVGQIVPFGHHRKSLEAKAQGLGRTLLIQQEKSSQESAKLVAFGSAHPKAFSIKNGNEQVHVASGLRLSNMKKLCV